MTAADTEPFESILMARAPLGPTASDETLHDLALDQVFARIGDSAPRASQAFRALLTDPEDIEYRHGVFRGLEDAHLRGLTEDFLRRWERCERADAEAARAHYRYGRELWHLSAVAEYVAAVEALDLGLADTLPDAGNQSAGWRSLARHVAAHAATSEFAQLREDARGLQRRLSAVGYNALIRGAKVTIAPLDDERDLREAVLATFERFRQGDVVTYSTATPARGMDHVQAAMLELVARIHAEPFEDLVRFTNANPHYRDHALTRFAEEVRFYLAYLDYVDPLQGAGLPVCYPEVSASSKKLAATDTWDLALAARCLERAEPVVTNDLSLTEAERILVISGPNQGGKTTTARTFGQLHHLAGLGCPIPGREATIFLCDHVLTVFEREEQLETLEGRLGAEIQRLHALFGAATGNTVIVINEAFSSTALQDARILTRDVLERICALDALAACVTFIDELSRLNDKTVSMVSAVDARDPAIRTFRVERKRADGRAYARALAAKHGLTFEQISQRMSEATTEEAPA